MTKETMNDTMKQTSKEARWENAVYNHGKEDFTDEVLDMLSELKPIVITGQSYHTDFCSSLAHVYTLRTLNRALSVARANAKSATELDNTPDPDDAIAALERELGEYQGQDHAANLKEMEMQLESNKAKAILFTCLVGEGYRPPILNMANQLIDEGRPSPAAITSWMDSALRVEHEGQRAKKLSEWDDQKKALEVAHNFFRARHQMTNAPFKKDVLQTAVEVKRAVEGGYRPEALFTEDEFFDLVNRLLTDIGDGDPANNGDGMSRDALFRLVNWDRRWDNPNNWCDAERDKQLLLDLKQRLVKLQEHQPKKVDTFAGEVNLVDEARDGEMEVVDHDNHEMPKMA